MDCHVAPYKDDIDSPFSAADKMGKLGTHGARQPKIPKAKANVNVEPSASSSNDAALLLKLKELTGGIDPEADDKTWLESLVVTSKEPVMCDDPNDDLKRELALYAHARALTSRTTITALPAHCSFFVPPLCALSQLQPGAGRSARGPGALRAAQRTAHSPR